MSGSTSGGKRKVWLVVGTLAFGVAAATTVGVVTFGLEKLKERVGGRAKQAPRPVGSGRHVVAQPVAMVVAPAPIPSALPLIVREGKDPYGYPRSYVDGPGLRSLLEHERFADLTRYVEQFQQEFEADPTKELWPIRAVESFASASPELLPKLDAWVTSSPTSFAPYAARGAYWTEVAWVRRGGDLARNTPPESFRGMHDAAVFARRDLQQALLHSPKLVAALRQQVAIAIPTSDEKLRASALRQTENVCPSCFSVRSKFVIGLEPRWGGSYQQMEDFAALLPVNLNSRLALLKGYADVDRSDVAWKDKNLDEALRLANQACALGQHWDFLGQRAGVLMAKEEFDEALVDLDAAIELRPELPHLLYKRARVRAHRKEWEAAGRDLIESLRLDASGDSARQLLAYVVYGLSSDGWAAHQRGDRDLALRLLDLASQLSPFDREVRQRHEQAVRGNVTGTADEIARLEQQIKLLPDDFRAHQQLDYALAKQRKLDRVIEMWTEYLGRHPREGLAYFERSGAYHNSGRKAEAMADLAKACELGVDQACAYQKRFK